MLSDLSMAIRNGHLILLAATAPTTFLNELGRADQAAGVYLRPVARAGYSPGECDDARLHAGLDVKLGENLCDVSLDGPLGDPKQS